MIITTSTASTPICSPQLPPEIVMNAGALQPFAVRQVATPLPALAPKIKPPLTMCGITATHFACSNTSSGILFQVALDLPRAHPPRVHRDDLVVEARPARLSLGYDLGIERGPAVARSFQLQFAKLTLQCLLAVSVARVAPVVARRVVLFVAQMIGHLGLQGSLQDGLGQLLEQAVLPDDILGLLIVGEQLVDQLLVDCHGVSYFLNPMAVYTVLFTPSGARGTLGMSHCADAFFAFLCDH